MESKDVAIYYVLLAMTDSKDTFMRDLGHALASVDNDRDILNVFRIWEDRVNACVQDWWSLHGKNLPELNHA